MALPSSSSSPIGVAIAGLGFGESVHLQALAAQSDLEAVALWHPRRERLDQACLEHNLPGYDDWEALLSDPRVQAVIIATPPQPRFALALQALKAGKHLLLEKPVALNAESVASCNASPSRTGSVLRWIMSIGQCLCSCRPRGCWRKVPSALRGW